MAGRQGHKIKVLYLCPNGYLGGAERFVIEINKAHLQSEVIESGILFFSDGVAVTEAREHGIPCEVLKTSFKFRNIPRLIAACREIRKVVKKGRFEIVHSTMPYAQIANFLATIFLPVKRVWFQHGPVGGFLDKVASFLPVNLILFNSSFTRKQHDHSHPCLHKGVIHEVIRISVSAPSPSISRVQEIREKALFDKRRFLLLSAGRITSWKGYETAIKSLAVLKAMSPDLVREVRLLIVGSATRESDTSYETLLHKMVSDYELEDEVLFMGHQPNIHEYLKACDVFIHSSKIPEPFGLVIAEAMVQGTLVIGSNLGGAADILRNGETGFTYDGSSENAHLDLARKISDVIRISKENRSGINEIVLRGQNLIRESYGPEQVNAGLEKMYMRIYQSGVMS